MSCNWFLLLALAFVDGINRGLADVLHLVFDLFLRLDKFDIRDLRSRRQRNQEEERQQKQGGHESEVKDVGTTGRFR